MKKGLFKESLGNLVSRRRPPEDIGTMYEKRMRMPLADEGCKGCGACSGICPSGAITIQDAWTVDIGKCIFCRECIETCEAGAISEVNAPDYVTDRKDLIFKAGESFERVPGSIDEIKRKTLGRSISIREVDTGSCNACEVEVNSLSGPFYDMERFGIKIAASPRHADVLLITGPLTENMHSALMKTVEATPDPKVIVAMGSCAISGGIFRNGMVVGEGIDGTADVDIYIPGCPPSPDMLMRVLLSVFTGRR